MRKEKLLNINIIDEELLPTPGEIQEEVPSSEKAAEIINGGREAIRRILDREDERLLVVVGPCSVHDRDSAIEYAEKLKQLEQEVNEKLLLVMRVYFEKPRTTVGWKGFINDPDLNDSFNITKGLKRARMLLKEVTEMGLPVGTEALDPITPQYIQEFVSWSAIGARTTESQTHREMASGLSTPVGIKNGTDGNIKVAINALLSVSNPHHFLGINREGRSAVFRTSGNSYGHMVLRGGIEPNYDEKSIQSCASALEGAGLPTNIMLDCSHGNSKKNHELQPEVFSDVLRQRLAGQRSIVGFMLESYLFPGRQELEGDPSSLKYGVSITDACIGWEETRNMLLDAAEKLT